MPTGRSAEVRRAIEITTERLAHDPRFEEIAREVGLAPRLLARRFSDELGITWRPSLRRLRLLRSIELLAGTERPDNQIAMDVGYDWPSAFYTSFRDLLGAKPTAYRDDRNMKRLNSYPH